jgi:hypothetical protein
MARRNVDQTYTTIDIIVDVYDDAIINKLKQKYPVLTIARVNATKFNKDSTNLLKFYLYHWLFDNYESAIVDIKNYYNKYTIITKAIA